MTHSKDIAKIILVSLLVFSCSSSAALALGIDDPYAWGENVGWFNWGTSQGDVDVPQNSGDLTGYVWGENVGWVSLNCSNTSSCGTVNYAVTKAGNGDLSGYAWGENVGWISFSCSNTASCGVVNYGVNVDDNTGVFTGWAWGENIGWMSVNCSNTSSCGSVFYRVSTDQSSGGGGGGFTNTPTPSLSPTPSPTATISSSPTVSPTRTPAVTPTPRPTTTATPFPPPSPFPTPPAPPPPIMPPGPTPGPGPTQPPGPIGRIIAFIGNLLDALGRAIFGFLGETCQGALGITSCSVTALAVTAVGIGLLAALLQNELAAAGYSLLQLFGIRKKARVWGVVYDSATKRPVPAAKIELIDVSGRVLEVRYADSEGRYGFLTTPASLNQPELRVSIRASKPGYRFPSALATSGTDYVVYERPYKGGVFSLVGTGIVNYSIPIDPVSPERTRLNGYGSGLFGGIAHRLLSLGFIIGLIAVPVNYYLQPTKRNLIILVVFFTMNILRFVISYRPYGVTVDAMTGKKLPYALVTLLDEQGNRIGFTVSDEHGRYVLSAQRNREYDVVAYTPANVLPQRTVKEHIARLSHVGRTAWVTRTLRV